MCSNSCATSSARRCQTATPGGISGSSPGAVTASFRGSTDRPPRYRQPGPSGVVLGHQLQAQVHARGRRPQALGNHPLQPLHQAGPRGGSRGGDRRLQRAGRSLVQGLRGKTPPRIDPPSPPSVGGSPGELVGQRLGGFFRRFGRPVGRGGVVTPQRAEPEIARGLYRGDRPLVLAGDRQYRPGPGGVADHAGGAATEQPGRR